jgi:hypothetical protein
MHPDERVDVDSIARPELRAFSSDGGRPAAAVALIS